MGGPAGTGGRGPRRAKLCKSPGTNPSAVPIRSHKSGKSKPAAFRVVTLYPQRWASAQPMRLIVIWQHPSTSLRSRAVHNLITSPIALIELKQVSLSKLSSRTQDRCRLYYPTGHRRIASNDPSSLATICATVSYKIRFRYIRETARKQRSVQRA